MKFRANLMILTLIVLVFCAFLAGSTFTNTLETRTVDLNSGSLWELIVFDEDNDKDRVTLPDNTKIKIERW